jgi:hypothetical protein
MTERWPSARKYRDIFEQVKSSVMDLIAEGRHQPRKTVDIIDVDMRESLAMLDQERLAGIGEDFTQMISQMTGQSMDLWDNQSTYLSGKNVNPEGGIMFPATSPLPQTHFYDEFGTQGDFETDWFPNQGFDPHLSNDAGEHDYSDYTF